MTDNQSTARTPHTHAPYANELGVTICAICGQKCDEQKPRGATVQVRCACCKEVFTARVADRKRGWAKFCSKSCKAIRQERITGQNAAYHERLDRREEGI